MDVQPVTGDQRNQADSQVKQHQRRVKGAMLNDICRVQMLEGCEIFQFHIRKQTAEGAQNIHAETQTKSIRGDIADPPDHQGDDQSDAQEKELEDQDTRQQESQPARIVFMFTMKKLHGCKAAHPNDHVGDDLAGQHGKQFAVHHLVAADRFTQQEIRG